MAEDVWKRLERRIKSARGRTESYPDGYGFRVRHNIEELRKLQGAIEDLIDAELIRGRDEQGASWGMLGSSKQQAQQRYKRATARRR